MIWFLLYAIQAIMSNRTVAAITMGSFHSSRAISEDASEVLGGSKARQYVAAWYEHSLAYGH